MSTLNGRNPKTLDEAKKIWTRFAKVVSVWLPDLGSADEWGATRGWAAAFGVEEDALNAWKRKDRPSRLRESKAVEMLEHAGVRARGGDPVAIARWVYSGDGELPPPTDEAAKTPRVLEGGKRSGVKGLVKSAKALAAYAEGAPSSPLVESLLRAARAGDLEAVAQIVTAIKPLASSEAARGLVAQIEKELQSPGEVLVESFSHLLQQHDEGHPLSVA